MKFIKENFDRSTDLERRIANYRANSHKIISESLDPKLVELAKKYGVQVEKFNDNIRVLGKNSDINSFYKEYLKFTGLDSDDPSPELDEDVKKLPNGKWANVGKDGKADSGKFKTKEEADAQRKAMFANGYKESIKEPLSYEDTKKILKDKISKFPKGALSRANIRDILVADCNYSTKDANDFVSKFGVSGVRTLVGESLEESVMDPLDKNETKKLEDYFKKNYPEEYEDAEIKTVWSVSFIDNKTPPMYFNNELKLKDYIKRNKVAISSAYKGKNKVIVLNGGKSSDDIKYIPIETPEVLWDNPKYDNKLKIESLEESVDESSTDEDKYKIWVFDKELNAWESWGNTDKPYVYPELAAAFGERIKVLPLGVFPKVEECLTEDVEIEIETKDEPKVEVEDSDEHSIENVPDMPQTDCKMTIATLLNPLIKDELEAIDGYNSTVATIRSMMEDETTDKSIDYEGIIAVISEITNEENLHIGQLEKLLETVSPNAKSIDDGKDEATEQLEETSNNEEEEVEVEESTEKEETKVED